MYNVIIGLLNLHLILTDALHTLQSIRETVRELEEKGRDLLALLQKAHPPADTAVLFTKAHCIITEHMRSLYVQLANKVPKQEYYKFVIVLCLVNIKVSR